MPGAKASLGLGWMTGGTGASPTSSAMYGSGRKASANTITGELVFLFLVELVIVGFIRFRFLDALGG